MTTVARSIIKTIVCMAVVVSILLPQPQAQASPPFGEAQAVSGQDDSPPLQQVLLAFPLELPHVREFAQPLSPLEAREMAQQIAFQQFSRLLPQLEQWKQEGVITDYEFRPDLHGVAVQALNVEQFAELSQMEGIASLLPFEGTPSECAAVAAQEFANQLERISQAAAFSIFPIGTLSSETQATDPSIEISWYEEDGWWYISGKTSPDISVTLRVIRNGVPLVTKTETSSDDGRYRFYSEYLGCPTNAYDLLIAQGDIVEVSAGGRTTRTEVVSLSAWLDPVANQLSGVTAPGRRLRVEISQANLQNACEWNDLEPLTGTAGGDGRFTINTPDINRTANAYILSMDSNGNGVYQGISAFGIYIDISRGWVYVDIKPNTSFTARHKRGDSILETVTGTSFSSGGGYVRFTDALQPDDVIEVISDAANMQYTVAALSGLSIDPNADRIQGRTAPGRRVSARFRKSSSSYLLTPILTSCEGAYDCGFQVADGSGNFNIAAPFDLARGDGVTLDIYDNEGNAQSHPLYAPALSLDPNRKYLDIVWIEPVNSVTVRHTDSGGTLKSVKVFYNFRNYSYSGYLDHNIEAGDRIEVSDGARTEILTVPAQLPAARLNTATGRLSGVSPAPAGWVAVVQDFQFPNIGSVSHCFERSGDGSFDVPLAGVQVGGGDVASIYFRLSDGHYLSLYPRAFQLYHWHTTTSLRVYTETPATSVTARLRRGGTDIETKSVNSDLYGYSYLFFDNASQTGDQIEVSTGDGNSYTLTVPDLSANLDPPNNRIYGRAPANQTVWVYLNRYASAFTQYSIRQTTTAGSDGNYGVNFNNQYFSYYRNGSRCEAASVGHRCARAVIEYYDGAGHGLTFWGDQPPPAPADAYENDDSLASAKPYSAIQTHTFHVTDDQDWVSFTVPQSDVDNQVLYRIQTLVSGLAFTNTFIGLFRSDGISIAVSNDGNEGFDWTPDAAGTYYVRVTPDNPRSAAYCDAYYDLLILPVRAQLYLPLIRR